MGDTYLANRHLPPCPHCGRRWSLEGDPQLIGHDESPTLFCSPFEGGCGYHIEPDEDGNDTNIDEADRFIRKCEEADK